MAEFKLSIEEYDKLPLPQRLKVDKWLTKYDITNVHTITMNDEDGVTCWGYNSFPFYSSTEPMEYQSDTSTTIITARFEYDDFPWEVLVNA